MPTANDNMLYLISELERSIEMPTVQWSATFVASMLRRLENLAETIRRVRTRDG